MVFIQELECSESTQCALPYPRANRTAGIQGRTTFGSTLYMALSFMVHCDGCPVSDSLTPLAQEGLQEFSCKDVYQEMFQSFPTGGCSIFIDSHSYLKKPFESIK